MNAPAAKRSGRARSSSPSTSKSAIGAVGAGRRQRQRDRSTSRRARSADAGADSRSRSRRTTIRCRRTPPSRSKLRRRPARGIRGSRRRSVADRRTREHRAVRDERVAGDARREPVRPARLRRLHVHRIGVCRAQARRRPGFAAPGERSDAADDGQPGAEDRELRAGRRASCRRPLHVVARLVDRGANLVVGQRVARERRPPCARGRPRRPRRPRHGPTSVEIAWRQWSQLTPGTA